jgi:exodeoxyribonuclease VII small subunit
VTEQTSSATPVDGLSYEAARDELVDIVRRLEAGGTTLEESLDGARARLDAARAAGTDRDTGSDS